MNLYAKDRNLFQKIWDEIKYLYKLATAGSREARELERIRKTFEEAYREGKTTRDTSGDTKYLLSKDVNGDVFVDITEDIFDENNGESVARTIQRVLQERFNNLIDVHGQKFQVNKTTNDEFRRSEAAETLLKNSAQAYNDKLKTIANADEIIYAAQNWIGEAKKHIRKDDIVEFARGNIAYRVGENGYVADVLVGIRKNGAAVLYDLVNIYEKEIAEVPVTMASEKRPQRRQETSATDIIPQNSKKSSGFVKNSLIDENIKDYSTGYAYGETYFTMSYMQDGKEVATLEYGDYEGTPHVKMISVDEEYRRKGIATKLLQELQKKYPDTEIDFGMSTPDGTKLLDAITYDVTDESIVAKKQKLKNLQTELNELQENLEVLFDIENLSEAQEATLYDLGDRWQEIYERIGKLEKSLIGKKATKTFVKTDIRPSLSSEDKFPVRADGYGIASEDGEEKYKYRLDNNEKMYNDFALATRSGAMTDNEMTYSLSPRVRVWTILKLQELLE